MTKLGQFFDLIERHGLKISVTKSQLLYREVLWCGKLLGEYRVRHDPERLAALSSLPAPSNAAGLQRRLCVANWLRESVIDYSRVAEPLYEKLNTMLESSGQKKRVAVGIAVTWSQNDMEAYNTFLRSLVQSAQLQHPSSEATVCLFTDASDAGWAVVVT
uniref:RxLR effector candidate protein n=1 Tax=Hyaloperonospora arabidopsidis (strain Emoy2) TaxID=559515 RepID=M4BHW9_HYAAE